MIGPRIVIKHKYSQPTPCCFGAPRSTKFASEKTPRVYGSKDQLPSTRMGNFGAGAALVEAGLHARMDDYDAKVKRGDKDAAPRDLKLRRADVLAQADGGDPLLSRDELLTERLRKNSATRCGVPSCARGLQGCGPTGRPGVAIATFSDWWGYKQEA
jgi:hypothetical protein